MKRVKGTPEPEHVQEVPEHKVVPQPKPIKPIFDPKYMEPVRGLIFLGALQKEYFYGGHTFLIKTMTEGEILRVGQLTKDYKGSLSEYEAQRVYTVAAALVYVDGEKLIEPLSEDKKYDLIYEKANVIKTWYPPIIHYLHERYIELETTAVEATKKLKK